MNVPPLPTRADRPAHDAPSPTRADRDAVSFDEVYRPHVEARRTEPRSPGHEPGEDRRSERPEPAGRPRVEGDRSRDAARDRIRSERDGNEGVEHRDAEPEDTADATVQDAAATADGPVTADGDPAVGATVAAPIVASPVPAAAVATAGEKAVGAAPIDAEMTPTEVAPDPDAAGAEVRQPPVDADVGGPVDAVDGAAEVDTAAADAVADAAPEPPAATAAKPAGNGAATTTGAPTTSGSTTSSAPPSASSPGDPTTAPGHASERRAAAHAEANGLLARAELHRLTAGGSRLQLDLGTTDLGSIGIEAIDRGEGLQLQLRSDQASTRALLDEHLDELRDQLQADGFDLSSLDVGARRREQTETGRLPRRGEATAPGHAAAPVGPAPTAPAATITLDAIDLRL